MRRSRVLSFMSQWSSTNDHPKSASPAADDISALKKKPPPIDTHVPASPKLEPSGRDSPKSPSTPSRARGDSRVSTRPSSMMMTYQPLQVDTAQDTPPELLPIFTYLNAHSNRLYHEGYFLKLHDLDVRGRPSIDRVWNEVFSQLVGTVLSLWDASALDAAGEDGEVVPTFINLSDASLRMIESLPMNGAQGGTLQNVLSVSTAANNRYLFHFNSLHALTTWTAAIRQGMLENASLQEAYTGSLIAGKGRFLNNIKAIMERSKFVYEDWARVRFGAGTPWKRLWCVITPPDEKEYAKAQKTARKQSAYERVRLPKGDIKFYETRKVTKKTRPVATITDAYAAYAIYPQSKPLIDQSTLVKIEGLVTVHTSPESTSEGFVFVMPECHPAVSGFEMMLRFLFPVWDTFCLYGRPQRLIADTLDQRGLMFGMPRDRRQYGYLDILDVAGLIHTSGSGAWSERQWRRELKKLTAERMSVQREGGGSPRISHDVSARRKGGSRTSLPATSGGGVRFEGQQIYSSPGSRTGSPQRGPNTDGLPMPPPTRVDSAPPSAAVSPHKRSVSDTHGLRPWAADNSSRQQYQANDLLDDDVPPPPPAHGVGVAKPYGPGSLARIQSGAEVPTLQQSEMPAQTAPPVQPVTAPPAFTHAPNSRPSNAPLPAPELRRAHSNVDEDTLHQMRDASRKDGEDGREEWGAELPSRQQQPNPVATYTPTTADVTGLRADNSQGLVSNASTSGTRQLESTTQSSDREPPPPTLSDMSEHTTTPPTDQRYNPQTFALARPPAERTDTDTSLRAKHSIARKPLPRQQPEVHTQQAIATPEVYAPSPANVPSDSPWTGDVIDTEALDRLLEQDRLDSIATASSATPDYASTISSAHEPKETKERIRAGKLKTVGDPNYQPDHLPSGGAGRLDTWNADRTAQDAEIPVIDFGPTYAYKPTGRPGTGGTITPGQHEERRHRSRSRDQLRGSSRDRLTPTGAQQGYSPGESNRHSYFGARNTPSPGAGQESPNREAVAWRPASTSPVPPAHQRGASLSPEQWVQQRASMASQMQPPPPRNNMSHVRQNSSTSTNKLRKPPPGNLPRPRTPSGDLMQQTQQRLTPPSRPNSRGAGTYFPQPTAGASLTAREQMQVARATNSPLVNYTTSAQRKETEQHAPGLFGALAARQHEKENTAGNRNSMAVQHAITARQQQQYQSEMEAHAQAQAQYQMQMQREAAQQQQYQQAQYQQMMYSQSQGHMSNPNLHARQPSAASMGQQYRQSWYGGQQYPQGVQSPGSPGSVAGTQLTGGAPRQTSWERQQAIMSQVPGGAQQYQQQQGRY